MKVQHNHDDEEEEVYDEEEYAYVHEACLDATGYTRPSSTTSRSSQITGGSRSQLTGLSYKTIVNKRDFAPQPLAGTRTIVEEKPIPKWKVWTYRICGPILCLGLTAIFGWIILCMARLGFGDEEHAVQTVGVCTNTTSSDGTFRILTYNIFLVYCLPFGLGDCESKKDRKARLPEIADWLATRDEDVIFLQEVWSFHDQFRQEIATTGYCHFVMATSKEKGSGLAILSKHPIVETDFVDFYDAFGAGSGMMPHPFDNQEAYLFDKGVLYAKIEIENGETTTPIHLFNTHLISDYTAPNHDNRLLQHKMIDEFVLSKNISSKELVIVGGDLNEDKECQENVEDSTPVCENEANYNSMLEELSAVNPTLIGDLRYTYTTEDNEFKASRDMAKNESRKTQVLFDYVLYRDDHLIPDTEATTCQIIHAISNTTGMDMSEY